MKKSLLLFICMLNFAFICLAQNAPSVADQRATTLEQIKIAGAEVGLDEKQATKLKTVFEKMFVKMDAVKADTTLTPAVKQEKLKTINGEKDWNVQYILGDKIKAFTESRKKLMEAAKVKQ